MPAIAPHLVLYAHGSRDPVWRAPFEALRDRLRERIGADRVHLAYLEFASPTLEEALEDVAPGGAPVLILPLFLASGAHVRRDLPAEVERLRARWPGADLRLLPPVGEDPRVMTLMETLGVEALEGA